VIRYPSTELVRCCFFRSLAGSSVVIYRSQWQFLRPSRSLATNEFPNGADVDRLNMLISASLSRMFTVYEGALEMEDRKMQDWILKDHLEGAMALSAVK